MTLLQRLIVVLRRRLATPPGWHQLDEYGMRHLVIRPGTPDKIIDSARRRFGDYHTISCEPIAPRAWHVDVSKGLHF